MKKFCFYVLFALSCVTGMSQEIVRNEIDDFTGERVVETSWERIYRGGATGSYQTRVRFRYENGKEYIEFRIYTGYVTSCLAGDRILMKTDKGIVRVSNVEYAVTEAGAWHPDGINARLGIYLVCRGDMDMLAESDVRKVRFYFNKKYVDIELGGKGAETLKELYTVFRDCVGAD